MTENETSSFRLGSGPLEETREVPAQDDTVLQLRINKLTRRIRRTSMLLFLLMIVMFALGYWDLQGRFSQQANTGNREIKNITAVFDDRLNELDQNFILIEKKLGEDFGKLDKLTVKLQKDIGQLRKKLDAIDLSGTMQKEKKAMLFQMQKEFAPLKKDIDSLSQNMGAFDQRIQTQLAPLKKQISQTQTDLGTLQKDVRTSTNESIGKDDLALEMLKVKKAYQQQITSQAATIRKQVGLITERL
nr:hypothetical protein [Desulfobacterales bacterium]